MVKKGKQKNKSKEGGSTLVDKGSWVARFIQFAMSILAAYLSWHCSAARVIYLRIGLTVLAFFLPVYYLIFYVIFKVIMGQTCG